MKINHFQSRLPANLEVMTLYSGFNNMALESKAMALGIREVVIINR